MRALACAVLFLTRIPLPRLALDARDFARSVAYFAWVGVLIALGLAGAARLLLPLFGARLAALVLIALWVAITGGLHLDGLADTVDGLSGGRGERERVLTIMRDSRIGSHGALSLVLLVALKWAALEAVLTRGQDAWVIAPVGARFACTLLIAAFPYARSEGLGSAFEGAPHLRSLAVGGLALLAALVALGLSALLGAAAGLAVALALALRMKRLLGGLTGDVYGAAVELSELAALLAISSLH